MITLPRKFRFGLSLNVSKLLPLEPVTTLNCFCVWKFRPCMCLFFMPCTIYSYNEKRMRIYYLPKVIISLLRFFLTAWTVKNTVSTFFSEVNTFFSRFNNEALNFLIYGPHHSCSICKDFKIKHLKGVECKSISTIREKFCKDFNLNAQFLIYWDIPLKF